MSRYVYKPTHCIHGVALASLDPARPIQCPRCTDRQRIEEKSIPGNPTLVGTRISKDLPLVFWIVKTLDREHAKGVESKT